MGWANVANTSSIVPSHHSYPQHGLSVKLITLETSRNMQWKFSMFKIYIDPNFATEKWPTKLNRVIRVQPLPHCRSLGFCRFFFKGRCMTGPKAWELMFQSSEPAERMYRTTSRAQQILKDRHFSSQEWVLFVVEVLIIIKTRTFMTPRGPNKSANRSVALSNTEVPSQQCCFAPPLCWGSQSYKAWGWGLWSPPECSFQSQFNISCKIFSGSDFSSPDPGF